jgi:hypothetical protein
LGGRMLEALDQIARNLGCFKTMVGTTERNEEFHREKSMSPAYFMLSLYWDGTLTLVPAGFQRGGIEMSHHHFAPRKTVPPRASSRDPSPEHARLDSSSELGCGNQHPVVDVAPKLSLDHSLHGSTLQL